MKNMEYICYESKKKKNPMLCNEAIWKQYAPKKESQEENIPKFQQSLS